MTDSIKSVGNCRSLLQLLESYEVRIPIIQRDYAQGRCDVRAKAVRKRLIEDFITCLKEPSKTMDFNFIYGNTEGDIFYPVDGQQRLTSLYLLHWVIACRVGKIKEFCHHKSFTYATRNSANEFFRLLKKPNDQLIELAKGTNFKNNIRNYPWFVAEWNHDPTVLSALTFIEDLCNVLTNINECNTMFERLVNENSAIVFSLLDENSGGNTETAAAIKYIRMNARGKELTTFESIKAMLDSIIEKNNIKSKITDCYERTHIDVFYSMAKTKSKDILKLNYVLDEMSLAFFENIYKIADYLINRKSFINSDVEYLNELYEESQKNSVEIAFYDFYFEMLNRILNICKNEAVREKIEGVFDKKFMVDTNRKEVAFILYLYYLNFDETNDGKINCISEKINIFNYVLDNLNFVKWNESYYEVSNKLIQEISKSTCAISYFEENIFDVEGIEELLDDIKARIKEQHIKAKIIVSYEKDNYFFDSLEKQSDNRKIQYLLYISDLWTCNDDGFTEDKVNRLLEYMNISMKYFKRQELEWRKRYIVAGCSDNNRLLSCDDINKIDWLKKCKWIDDYYYWDDKNQPNIEKLIIVKRAYDSEPKQYNDKLCILKEETYNSCWLRYAVNRNYVELIKNQVYYNEKTKRVCIKYIEWNRPYERDYMAQVLILDLNNQNYKEIRGNLDVTEYGSKCYYGLVPIKKSVKATYTFSADKLYTHTAEETLKFIDWRNYNLSLYGNSCIVIEANPVGVAVSVVSNDNRYLRLFVPETLNSFQVYNYDLNEGINFLKNALEEFQKVYNNMTVDKLLEIYHSRTCWKHEGGNSHSWSQLKQFNVNQPTNYEEYTLT